MAGAAVVLSFSGEDGEEDTEMVVGDEGAFLDDDDDEFDDDLDDLSDGDEAG